MKYIRYWFLVKMSELCLLYWFCVYSFFFLFCKKYIHQNTCVLYILDKQSNKNIYLSLLLLKELNCRQNIKHPWACLFLNRTKSTVLCALWSTKHDSCQVSKIWVIWTSAGETHTLTLLKSNLPVPYQGFLFYFPYDYS